MDNGYMFFEKISLEKRKIISMLIFPVEKLVYFVAGISVITTIYKSVTAQEYNAVGKLGICVAGIAGNTMLRMAIIASFISILFFLKKREGNLIVGKTRIVAACIAVFVIVIGCLNYLAYPEGIMLLYLYMEGAVWYAFVQEITPVIMFAFIHVQLLIYLAKFVKCDNMSFSQWIEALIEFSPVLGEKLIKVPEKFAEKPKETQTGNTVGNEDDMYSSDTSDTREEEAGDQDIQEFETADTEEKPPVNICPECQNEVDKEWSACPFCGKELR